jgi:hypothetical protein
MTGSLRGIDRLTIVSFGEPIIPEARLRQRQGLERLRLERLPVECLIEVRQSGLELSIEQQLMSGKVGIDLVRGILLRRFEEFGLGVVGSMEFAPIEAE